MAATDAESEATFELGLLLPARPLLPKNAVALGLPATPEPLQVAVTPHETLNDLRATLLDSPEGYWLGAFAFRRPSKHAQAGERVPEWQPLSEVFPDGAAAPRVLQITYEPFNELEVRVHLQRLRDLLAGSPTEPSAIAVDAGATVHDAICHPAEWAAEAHQPAPETPTWRGWPADTTTQLLPALARAPRVLPRCVRGLALSAWNPPPRSLALQGHLLYLQVDTLEGEILHITASVHGFFVNGSSSQRFLPHAHPTKDLAAPSLFDLLCAASPLFLQHLARLFHDPVSTRDYFSALPVLNSLPAAPWLAREPKHDADWLRTQTAFLLTGALTADTLEASRDWNEELQSSRELPRTSLVERLMRDRVLNRLHAEFTLAAARIVPRVAAGDVAPMNPADAPSTHMFLFNNLFVTRGIDSVGLYEGLGGDAAAHVAVSKDAQGVRSLALLDVPGLHLLGTAVIDWLGERWVVQTVLPGLFRQVAADAAASDAEPTHVAHGGLEGPDTIHTDAAFDELMRQAAQRLHLAPHTVRDAHGTPHEMALSVDCKGLHGTDGRRYVLDVARLTPTDIGWIENEMDAMYGADGGRAAYPHRHTLLRPELLDAFWEMRLREFARERLEAQRAAGETPTRVDVADFDLSFNSDAFAQFRSVQGDEPRLVTPVTDENEPGVQAVRAASEYLRREVLVRFVSDIAAGLTSAVDGLALTQQMHARGINMRYLGRLAHLSEPAQASELDEAVASKLGPGYEALLDAFRRVVLHEMVARAAKHRLRAHLRTAGPASAPACIAHVFNCLLGTSVHAAPAAVVPPGESGAWTQLTPAQLADEVRDEVRARFRYELPASFLTQELRKMPMLRALCLKTGVQLAVRDYAMEAPIAAAEPPAPPRGKKGKKSAPAPAPRDTVFVPEDVVCVVPVVKHATPQSALVEEAFEAGRLSLARGDRELGCELLLEGIGFHEQVYGLVHPETAKCYSLFASLAHHYAVDMARAEAKKAQAKETEGKAQETEGKAQETEGKAQETEGKAQETEGKAQETEGKAQETEGKAQETEGETKETEGEAAQDTAEDAVPAIVAETMTLENALRFQRQAVTVSERTLGLDHPDTMVQYINLAVLERSAGHTDEALRYQERILSLWQLLYGRDHPDAVHTLSSIALLLQSRHDFGTSLKVYEAAHELAERLFGPDSIYTGNMAHELSQAHTLHGDLKAAIDVEKNAHRIFQARLGDEDALTKESEAFLKGLTASAVRVAQLEQAAKAQQTADLVAAQARARTERAAQARRTTHGNPQLADRSIDELVQFIQGAPGTGTSRAARKRAARARQA
ncbi:Intracellular distribution of mitochondria [Malassezia caprae]|uniref:Clustered mitochondria protein homolog n=1 Tax=Malassezia caprae TaxID=1381934 RepID=A0AAF0IWA7_9BASI|nr:Intracellular distribution of mitochondria [Malassezia caprae]